MISREFLEEQERRTLKPYACLSCNSIRKQLFRSHPYRTEFQRDRDRILHSKAFRRLEYKTQVFLTQKSDHLRTRLTHSLEVAQLSRTIAFHLGLNNDLVEAIALGHDVGHTPFGHAGERKLIELLENKGIFTFKHNSQSVRILDLLEKKYYNYDGLALTLPVREGILKHTKLPKEIPSCCKDLYIERPFSVTLEGQVVAIADEIAQISHDLDDYLRYNIIPHTEIMKHKIFNDIDDFYSLQGWNFNQKLLENDEIKNIESIIRCLVDYLVTKLIEESEANLVAKEKDLKAFELDNTYIDFSPTTKAICIDFKKYLEGIMFSDLRVKEMDKRGKNIVETLFSHYFDHPDYMPESTFDKYEICEGNDKILVIADFISGMTDRFAIQKYNDIIEIYRPPSHMSHIAAP